MARPDAPVHFLHISKAGGTAIKHALAPVAANHRVVLHPHFTTLRDVPAGESVIFFLRDPLTRFVSAFYSRQREGRPKYVLPWSPEEAAAFGRFRTPNELANGLSSISTAERKKAERAMRSIPHVSNSYWNWLIDPAYLDSRADAIFFIGLQEHLADDFAIMRARLGIPDSVRLPDDDTDAHRSPASHDRKLDAEATRNLTAWYREDLLAMRACKRVAQDRHLGGSIVDAAWIDATELRSSPSRSTSG